MADLVSSIFVVTLLLGYSALLVGLLVWMLHGWVGPRLKAWAARRLSPRLWFLRLLHRN